ncbi:MAG: hypothetical protein EOP70_03795 [Variovorax sp.]|jgi:hypothetical protein|nr:MAG: hypothetical protein EOP70_03795 [Variovorax sp.]
MKISGTASTGSTASPLTGIPTLGRASSAMPVYVRTAEAKQAQRAPIAHGIVDRAPHQTRSISELQTNARLAAIFLDSYLSPGEAIDLGKMNVGRVPGYICRRTASGDGFVIQTHEQARSAPFSGLFFPSTNNPGGAIALDMTPLTSAEQLPLPSPVEQALYAASRFTARYPKESLLFQP